MISEDSPAGLRSLASGRSEPHAILPLPAYPWRTRVLLPAGLALTLLSLAGWSARESLLPVTEVQVVPAVLRPASENASNGSVTASDAKAPFVIVQSAGWIEPDPFATGVTALTDGTVADILVFEGQSVKAGDMVVRLIADDAKLAVARAEAELALRKAELIAAEQRWNHPIEQDREVAITASLADETQAELTRLNSEIAAEAAREAELADLLRRLEPMVLAKAASEQELQTTRFQLDAQRATLAATKARRPMLQAQLRKRSADSLAATQSAALRIDDRRQLDSATAAVQLSEAHLAEARLRLDRTEVRAPADGIVMNLLIEPGAKLMLGNDSPTSAYIARIYDPSKLQVRVDVPLSDASKIAIGAPAEVIVDSMPNRVFRGEVARLVHQADVAKNTIQFKVRLLETGPGLMPDVLARVRFLASVTNESSESDQDGGVAGTHWPFIPETLIKRNGDAASVTIVDRAAGAARVRTVSVGRTSHEGWVAITAGLSAGDVLIAEPTDVREGDRVRVAGELAASTSKDGL